MIRRTMAVAVATLCVTTWGVAVAAPVGPPDIHNADAKLSASGPTLQPKACLGVHGVGYVTYRGSFKGSETEIVPGSTDYNLTGALVIGKIEWTVNQKTLRGLLTAGIQLKNSAGALQYRGNLTLVTQGTPGTTVASARGFIQASTFVANVLDGGSLVANVEGRVSPTSIAGFFGDLPSPASTPDYSVTTINRSC